MGEVSLRSVMEQFELAGGLAGVPGGSTRGSSRRLIHRMGSHIVRPSTAAPITGNVHSAAQINGMANSPDNVAKFPKLRKRYRYRNAEPRPATAAVVRPQRIDSSIVR